MVKEIENSGKKYYQCEECEMYFLKEDIAQKCENFCRENKSCNLELIKHAVKLDDAKCKC